MRYMEPVVKSGLLSTHVHCPPGEDIPGVQKTLPTEKIVGKIYHSQWRTEVTNEINDFSPKHQCGTWGNTLLENRCADPQVGEGVSFFLHPHHYSPGVRGENRLPNSVQWRHLEYKRTSLWEFRSFLTLLLCLPQSPLFFLKREIVTIGDLKLG